MLILLWILLYFLLGFVTCVINTAITLKQYDIRRMWDHHWEEIHVLNTIAFFGWPVYLIIIAFISAGKQINKGIYYCVNDIRSRQKLSKINIRSYDEE